MAISCWHNDDYDGLEQPALRNNARLTLFTILDWMNILSQKYEQDFIFIIALFNIL